MNIVRNFCFIGLLILSVVIFYGCKNEDNTDYIPIGENTTKIYPPTNIRAQTETNGVTLYWSDVGNALSFDIYYGLSPNNLQFFINRTALISGSTISYFISSSSGAVSDGNVYYFAIKSNGSAGISDFSDVVSAFLPPANSGYISQLTSPSNLHQSNHHRNINKGEVKWYCFDANEGVSYSIHVSNNRYTSDTTSTIANVSGKYYLENGSEFNGNFISDKKQIIYIKINATSAGVFRMYYQIN